MKYHRRIAVRLNVVFVLAWLGLATEARADLVGHWPLSEDFDNLADENFHGYLVDDPEPAIVEFVPVELNDDGFGPAQDFAAEFTGANSFVQTDYPGIGGNNPRTIACWISMIGILPSST